MNKGLLIYIHDNLMSWLTRAGQETVSVDKKLELIMFSLAEMCAAIGRDTEETDAIDDDVNGPNGVFE